LVDLGAGLEGIDLFDGGIVVAAEAGFARSGATYGWTWIRLPAGLVAGWEERGVCVVSEGRDGVVAAGFGEWEDEAVDGWWGGKCGAAMVAGWETDRVGFDAIQQPFSCVHGGRGEWRVEECGEANGGNEEFPAPVLLQRVRHGDQSGLDAGWKGDSVCVEPRTYLWDWRILADEDRGAFGIPQEHSQE